MTTPSIERKIEAAIEDHLRAEGWMLDLLNGDHLAEWHESIGKAAFSISINITECAKAVAAGIVKCAS